MKLINPNSLSVTLDALNEVLYFGRSVSVVDKRAVAKWIAGRQGLKGAYCGMFAPTALDFSKGVRLFTEEKVVSGAAIGHILGEESNRVLMLLDGATPVVREALNKATRGMMKALTRSETRWKVRGFYCCGTCTASLWRNLAVGGLRQSRKRLSAGMKVLKHYRDGSGRWRRFPFYYTLLALSELDLKAAVAEMRYAAPVCAGYLNRYTARNKIAKRRRVLMERVLAKC